MTWSRVTRDDAVTCHTVTLAFALVYMTARAYSRGFPDVCQALGRSGASLLLRDALVRVCVATGCNGNESVCAHVCGRRVWSEHVNMLRSVRAVRLSLSSSSSACMSHSFQLSCMFHSFMCHACVTHFNLRVEGRQVATRNASLNASSRDCLLTASSRDCLVTAS